MSTAPDPRVAAYLASNRAWALGERYETPVKFCEMQEKGRAREDGTVIVVACTDPRVTPEEFLDMNNGNKATVVRTAGGRVHSALSTLLVLSAVGNVGKKGTIMVVHHTDCGLQSISSDEEIRNILRGSLNSEKGVEMLKHMKFGCITDPEESVKDDVRFLRDCPFFKGMQIVGLLQDTPSGLLKQVL